MGQAQYSLRENLLILVPLSQGHSKIFNMAKKICFQNYLPKTKHVCDTDHIGKLVAQFMQLIQLYTLFKVSRGHAFIARPISRKQGNKEKN